MTAITFAVFCYWEIVENINLFCLFPSMKLNSTFKLVFDQQYVTHYLILKSVLFNLFYNFINVFINIYQTFICQW